MRIRRAWTIGMLFGVRIFDASILSCAAQTTEFSQHFEFDRNGAHIVEQIDISNGALIYTESFDDGVQGFEEFWQCNLQDMDASTIRYLGTETTPSVSALQYLEFRMRGKPDSVHYRRAIYRQWNGFNNTPLDRYGDELRFEYPYREDLANQTRDAILDAINHPTPQGRANTASDAGQPTPAPVTKPDPEALRATVAPDPEAIKAAAEADRQSALQQAALAEQQQLKSLTDQDNATAAVQISSHIESNEIIQNEASDASLAINSALTTQDPQLQAEMPQTSEDLKRAFLSSSDDNVIVPFSDVPIAQDQGSSNGSLSSSPAPTNNDQTVNPDQNAPSTDVPLTHYYLKIHDNGSGNGVRGDNSDQMAPAQLQASGDLINDLTGTSPPSVQDVIAEGFNQIGNFAASVQTSAGSALNDPSIRFLYGVAFGSAPNVSGSPNDLTPDDQLLAAIDKTTTDDSSAAVNALYNIDDSNVSRNKATLDNFGTQQMANLGTYLGLANTDIVQDSGRGGPSS